MSVEQQFQRRAAVIPRLGLGLSVDVYSPDLWEVMRRFQDDSRRPAYLEIFKADVTVLQAVRQCFPDVPLAYHGEGLWVTQPDFDRMPSLEEELCVAASHLDILGSSWLNHECASKEMAGYSFGTYLPPLYTPESAAAVADNVALVQERLDKKWRQRDAVPPLFLLEMPPLTYFMVGTLTVQEYFRLITDRVPCGLVLDIGHLWTVYRYSAARRQSSLTDFVARFLDVFPVERVIEIHLAGLAVHETAVAADALDPNPEWIDAHAAPIPPVSWAMLEQVLAHPRLCNLRAVALEVDTKPIERIVQEFGEASARCGVTVEQLLQAQMPPHSARESLAASSARQANAADLEADYARYAQVLAGLCPPEGVAWKGVIEDPVGFDRYVNRYLPHELLHWGGEIADMFPETVSGLKGQDVELRDFVPWWFQTPRPKVGPYDFFLLKIDRWLQFVAEQAPALSGVAGREATTLRAAYVEANRGGRPLMEPCG